MAENPSLEAVKGPLEGRMFEVGAGGLRLGRSSSCDIHVPDARLSRNHCLFEASGPTGLRVTDLASANGTLVNGEPAGAEPVPLSPGDLIEAGGVVLRVVGGPRREAQVDLGLSPGPDASSESAGTSAPPRRRPAILNLLWVLAALACAAAIYVVLAGRRPPVEPPAAPAEPEVPVVKEAFYEKVEANESRIFRYAMTLSADSTLTVKVDDVPDENRHHVKSQPLGAEALAELNEILAWRNLKDLDREYVGVEPDPPALESWSLRVVYSNRVRTVKVVNTQEPEAFRAIRERLEAFSKSELGVWAIQYSRGKLLELAEKAVELGESKWADRDVEYGNLAASVEAYREALFYLETVNPKPPIAATARDGLERSQNELADRCRNQRFLADRALNLARWEDAKRELMVLLEMVPDRRDDRHRDARDKLLSAESHLKKGGAR